MLPGGATESRRSDAGTGGIRKLRWRCDSHGKSGGVRVIYYYHDDRMPPYLLTLFAKGDKANLTKAERNENWPA